MSHVNEYETSVNHVTMGYEKDEYVVVESSEKTVISALESKPESFEKVWEDNTPGLPRLVRFRISITDVNWAGLAKRKGSPRPHLQEARRAALGSVSSPSTTVAA
ncbi:MAG: hypothetical protein ACRDPS_09685 [Nocardioides sp.]|uniref:hypothetical protein n=1 Tax=Nocardioides sp. TaxID=35761 RepID=UPI003D6B7B37